ncbi:glycosyltransferase family 4 protein [Methylobacterium marchantiae]|uniref:Glycosyltransferase family 4 protein n=1 Tax=Methylobacterium marchantiae TaxID=600331 RepID=A0ABW3X524_9HYPH|nr:D-inositol-3-phosphate glycosyltransferase [Methylobacterium marchantiae]
MTVENILMDYTDLVSFFKRGLPITGIQRVVYEITSAIQADDRDCVITPIGITPFKRRLAPIGAPMLELIEAYGRTNTVQGRSLVAKAVEELSYVRIFKGQAAAAADISMPRANQWLVMLGASWSRSNYAGIVSALKSADIACRKAVLVHDMLPIERPKLTFRSAHATFKRWIDLVLETADVIFTPSHATAEALIAYQGFDCGRIVTLDFGVSQIGDNTPPKPLKVAQPYILYVSSVHPRKNHRVVIKAWSLAFKGREQEAPSLVCVGHSKRKKRMMLRAIVRRTPLARKLHFLAKVDDLALRTLYKNCQMFVFPSRYEGWGLPVAEALSFGKFGIVSRTTSLPEVGQHFVDYATPHMPREWADKIRAYATDPELLRQKEREIDRNFRPTKWTETGRQVVSALQRFDERAGTGRTVKQPAPPRRVVSPSEGARQRVTQSAP